MRVSLSGRSPTARRVRATAASSAAACLAAAVIVGLAGCGEALGPVLTQLVEARRLVADLRVQFTKGADASNRAVMAYNDEGAGTAAREAQTAMLAVQGGVRALQPILQKLAYAEEGRQLEEFDRRFAEYRALDNTILGLAVENTNLKAQRLSFGPAREAAEAVRDSLELVARASPQRDPCRVAALVDRAVAAVRAIQVLQAPHIAEADDAEMSSMEQQMAAAEAAARSAIASLKTMVPPSHERPLAAATAGLNRFTTLNSELVALSRRNSNVRSLALSLGRKRTLTAACDESLQALQETLAKRDFTATR